MDVGAVGLIVEGTPAVTVGGVAEAVVTEACVVDVTDPGEGTTSFRIRGDSACGAVKTLIPPLLERGGVAIVDGPTPAPIGVGVVPVVVGLVEELGPGEGMWRTVAGLCGGVVVSFLENTCVVRKAKGIVAGELEPVKEGEELLVGVEGKPFGLAPRGRGGVAVDLGEPVTAILPVDDEDTSGGRASAPLEED